MQQLSAANGLQQLPQQRRPLLWLRGVKPSIRCVRLLREQ